MAVFFIGCLLQRYHHHSCKIFWPYSLFIHLRTTTQLISSCLSHPILSRTLTVYYLLLPLCSSSCPLLLSQFHFLTTLALYSPAVHCLHSLCPYLLDLAFHS